MFCKAVNRLREQFISQRLLRRKTTEPALTVGQPGVNNNKETMTYKYTGGCYCQNVTFEMETTSELNSYSPRACDCNFCIKHTASYISDNNGKLTIYAENQSDLSRYKQGDKIADFLVCKICGVLVGACYEDRGCLYATINSKAVDRDFSFAKDTVVSPKILNGERKKQRWRDFWFSNVDFKHKT